jgi:copper chaperone CopZ
MGRTTFKCLALEIVGLASVFGLAAVLVGLSLQGGAAPAHAPVLAPVREAVPASAPAKSSGNSSKAAVSIDFGRVVCGDCCVAKVWGALGALPGVRDIDVRAGQSSLTVFYDTGSTPPEQFITSLIAAGETSASLAAINPDASGAAQEKRWVRTAER